jgi:hypothetical protein
MQNIIYAKYNVIQKQDPAEKSDFVEKNIFVTQMTTNTIY